MFERNHTDFLFPDGSVLSGAATVFNVGGRFFRYNVSGSREQADARALRQDFAMIGQDILDVTDRMAEQQTRQLKLKL